MAKKRLKKLVESGFIPGIYNYCDRWCERCEQQLHCMSFVMGKRIEEKGGFNFGQEVDQEEESIWSRLKNIFESTYEVLHELAEEQGIEVEDIYASENINKEFWGEELENRTKVEEYSRRVEMSDIVRICVIYENLADKYLERIFDYFEGLGVKDKVLDEAFDVVNWYLDLIQAKMRRAFYGYYHEKSLDGKEVEDYNGSAKVALIAIERSIEGWHIIREKCLDYRQEIGHLLVILSQLAEDINKQFPQAWDFQRPGFDQPEVI